MKVRHIRLRAKASGMSSLGKRCHVYEQGCPICDGWRFRDEHGRFVYNWEELRQYRNKLIDERVEKEIQEARRLTKC